MYCVFVVFFMYCVFVVFFYVRAGQKKINLAHSEIIDPHNPYLWRRFSWGGTRCAHRLQLLDFFLLLNDVIKNVPAKIFPSLEKAFKKLGSRKCFFEKPTLISTMYCWRRIQSAKTNIIRMLFFYSITLHYS